MQSSACAMKYAFFRGFDRTPPGYGTVYVCTVEPPLYGQVLGGARNSDLPISQNKGRCNVMNPMYYKKDYNLVCFLVFILFLLLTIVVSHEHAQYGH